MRYLLEIVIVAIVATHAVKAEETSTINRDSVRILHEAGISDVRSLLLKNTTSATMPLKYPLNQH